MQVDRVTQQLYEKEAPELLGALSTGEADVIMKRDPKSDYCVKFDGGLCNIHKEKGSRFLSDACHFYPRVTRKLGGETYQSAALSCPEIARLALYEKGDMFQYETVQLDRLPESLKDYKPAGVTEAKAAETMQAFLRLVLRTPSPERAVALLMNVSQSLELIDISNWPEAAPLFIRIAEERLPAPESHPADDYRLLNILVALVSASKQTERPRLEETIHQMERALKVHIDRESLGIVSDGGVLDAHEVLRPRWDKFGRETMAPVLTRWLAAELSIACFPFAGFGHGLKDRAVVLGVRFATLRLALMAHVLPDGTLPSQAEVIRIVQSLARFMDHLADPAFSLMAYQEAGWTKEPRLRALVGDR